MTPMLRRTSPELLDSASLQLRPANISLVREIAPCVSKRFNLWRASEPRLCVYCSFHVSFQVVRRFCFVYDVTLCERASVQWLKSVRNAIKLFMFVIVSKLFVVTCTRERCSVLSIIIGNALNFLLVWFQMVMRIVYCTNCCQCNVEVQSRECINFLRFT